MVAAPQTEAPVVLAGLTEREAVADALYRSLRAFDTGDESLFESSFTDDAVLILAGREMKGKQAIREGSFNHISKLDTTHYVTNLRTDVKSDGTAFVTANALAQHYLDGEGMKPNAPQLLGGSLYELKFVKDGQLWRIAFWKLTIVWGQGDFSILSSH